MNEWTAAAPIVVKTQAQHATRRRPCNVLTRLRRLPQWQQWLCFSMIYAGGLILAIQTIARALRASGDIYSIAVLITIVISHSAALIHAWRTGRLS